MYRVIVLSLGSRRCPRRRAASGGWRGRRPGRIANCPSGETPRPYRPISARNSCSNPLLANAWAKMRTWGFAGVAMVAIDETWSAMRYRPAERVGK